MYFFKYIDKIFIYKFTYNSIKTCRYVYFIYNTFYIYYKYRYTYFYIKIK